MKSVREERSSGSGNDDDDDDDDGKQSDSEGSEASNKLEESTSSAIGSHTNDSSDDAHKEVELLANRETQRIQFCRLVVVIIILFTGLMVSAGTFVYLSSENTAAYQDGYLGFEEMLEENFRYYIRNQFKNMEELGDALSVMANKTNDSFPFVTPFLFESIAHRVRLQTGFQKIMFMPYVEEADVETWLNYSQGHVGWIQDSRAYAFSRQELIGIKKHDTPVTPFLFEYDENDTHWDKVPVAQEGKHAPVWLVTPPPDDMSDINEDMMAQPFFQNASQASEMTKDGVFSGVMPYGQLFRNQRQTDNYGGFLQFRGWSEEMLERGNVTLPFSVLLSPVYADSNDHNSKLVGFLMGTVQWNLYLTGLLPEGVEGVYCVLKDSCGETYTFRLNGAKAHFLGPRDLHDKDFDSSGHTISLSDGYKNLNITKHTTGHCMYTITSYSSLTYESNESSNTPVLFSVLVAILFLLVVLTFCAYDVFVRARNAVVVNSAVRANNVLNSLFPKAVRERLFRDMEEEEKLKKNKNSTAKSNLHEFLQYGDRRPSTDDDIDLRNEKPIADLFPATTIFFADIVGFTSWSSVREPSQVFILLETVYHAFDVIAKRRRIFKVETVGDCYVAVTGLPEPRKDHAIAMCRFARDCLFKFRSLTKKLEVTLGPDTSELDIRIGMHSGPVTAGVLRGDQSRFQLFGDTMNYAARMEATSEKGGIQVSHTTAALLREDGKDSWLTPRSQKVDFRGKGAMQTYWLSVGAERKVSIARSSECDKGSLTTDSGVDEDFSARALEMNRQEDKLENEAERMIRLVEWNVEVLSRLLKQIISRRNASASRTASSRSRPREEKYLVSSSKHPLDEVVDIIHLPKFDAEAARNQEDIKNIKLPPDVVVQLYRFVSDISKMYKTSNPFHNFEHASHVAMSVNKLLSRIVAPDVEYSDDAAVLGETLHDHTYGITSDPLTQFSCFVGALIHDVDHSGVPNAQLVKERTATAQFYHNKTVAEQNSVDLAWSHLMGNDFRDLRQAIYTNDDELRRFRQLIVNAVMATDIADKDLKVRRNDRWAKAFHLDTNDGQKDTPEEEVNRKATIVIEHLMQASDVAHTMQHWFVYRKWNENFFMECYKAYKEGRAETDPSENWYKGEIGFFDFYVLPLAKKLKDCGVFGVSSDEYLQYATQNRQKWEELGHEAVSEFIETARNKDWSEKAAPLRSSFALRSSIG